jgi:hypothetical protein
VPQVFRPGFTLLLHLVDTRTAEGPQDMNRYRSNKISVPGTHTKMSNFSICYNFPIFSAQQTFSPEKEILGAAAIQVDRARPRVLTRGATSTLLVSHFRLLKRQSNLPRGTSQSHRKLGGRYVGHVAFLLVEGSISGYGVVPKA